MWKPVYIVRLIIGKASQKYPSQTKFPYFLFST